MAYQYDSPIKYISKQNKQKFKLITYCSTSEPSTGNVCFVNQYIVKGPFWTKKPIDCVDKHMNDETTATRCDWMLLSKCCQACGVVENAGWLCLWFSPFQSRFLEVTGVWIGDWMQRSIRWASLIESSLLFALFWQMLDCFEMTGLNYLS